jgi:hypothetical protein
MLNKMLDNNKDIKISGFSYVRNGFSYGVPFIQAITSILPICDEMVIAVGDSNDGTKEALLALKDSKIKVIDTVWDMQQREGGKIFAQQTNIALAGTTGNWAFHIQADEVIHENDLSKIVEAIHKENTNLAIDGFILPFLHFWGDYEHIRNSRRVHKHEVRIFRKNNLVKSYKDSQGFKKYKTEKGYLDATDEGQKLNVKKIDAPIFHYNGIRTPRHMFEKIKNFEQHYGNYVEDQNENITYDLNYIDRVTTYKGSHPKVMQSLISNHSFKFVHDKSKAIWKTKDKLIQPIEDLLGFKFGEYKNYILKK